MTAGTEAAPEKAAPLEPLAPARKTIVVAEDDADMRVLIAGLLRAAGYEVMEASSGAELSALLRNIPSETGARGPDLVVSDIRMPEGTGLDVLAELRDTNSTVPMLLVTAFGSAATHEQARRLGALIVLDKPFELDELEQVVHTIVGGPRRRRSRGKRREHQDHG
jgi:DNA-binding response OmpR family regulator